MEGDKVETKVEVWGETIESDEQKNKRKKEETERPMRRRFNIHHEMLRSGRSRRHNQDQDQRVGKRSAWTEPRPRLPAKPRLPIRLTGDFHLQSSIQCDACANIFAHGSILPSRDKPYRYYVQKGCPIKHYLSCPNCSKEMVIETVEGGEPGFKSLVGATEYSGPVDEGNKVVPTDRPHILCKLTPSTWLPRQAQLRNQNPKPDPSKGGGMASRVKAAGSAYKQE